MEVLEESLKKLKLPTRAQGHFRRRPATPSAFRSVKKCRRHPSSGIEGRRTCPRPWLSRTSSIRKRSRTGLSRWSSGESASMVVVLFVST